MSVNDGFTVVKMQYKCHIKCTYEKISFLKTI